MVFGNWRLLRPLLAMVMKYDPTMKAQVHTAFSPTIIQSGTARFCLFCFFRLSAAGQRSLTVCCPVGYKKNVIPGEATASINVRPLSQDSPAEIVRHLDHVVGSILYAPSA